MAKKDYYTLKRGEAGTVMEFTLKDADGAVNLAGWTVTLTVRKGGDDPVIEDAACAVLPNQNTTGKGQGTFTFDGTTSAIAAGTYRLEFKAVSPGDAVHYFPKAKGSTYATLVVQEPLA